MSTMMRCHATNLIRLCAGLIAALVLGDIVSPSAVQAGCGDHVHFTRDGLRDRLDRQPRPVAPCHGIFCSQQPDPTPLAPVTPRLILPDVWDQMGAMDADVDSAAPGWQTLDESELPIRLATSIFHPPR